MSLVRVACLCGEHGESPILAQCTRKPQKALKTHNTFKPLWSVAHRRNKPATQLPAADWEVPRCLAAAAHAECNPPLNLQYGEADRWVGPRRSAPQGSFFERRDDLCITPRAIQLLVERACRIGWPAIAQRHTTIGQQGDRCTKNLGRDSWEEPDSR